MFNELCKDIIHSIETDPDWEIPNDVQQWGEYEEGENSVIDDFEHEINVNEIKEIVKNHLLLKLHNMYLDQRNNPDDYEDFNDGYFYGIRNLKKILENYFK